MLIVIQLPPDITVLFDADHKSWKNMVLIPVIVDSRHELTAPQINVTFPF